MADFWGNLDKGFQYKPTLVHGRMGNLQVQLFNDHRINEKDVDVNGARALRDIASAPEFPFCRPNRGQDLFGTELSFEFHNTINKPRLLS